jgi:hypothetical protein
MGGPKGLLHAIAYTLFALGGCMRNNMKGLVAGLALALSACGTIESKPYQGNESEEGLSYFLPKIVTTVKVSRTTATDLKIEVEMTGTGDTAKPKVIVIPDRDSQRVLVYSGTALSSERLCIARSSRGLLKYVQFASDSKIDEILVNLAELAAKLGSPLKSSGVETARNAAKLPFEVSQPIDPSNPDDIAWYNKLLADEGYRISLPEFEQHLAGNVEPQKCEGYSICYRNKITTPLVLEMKSPTEKESGSLRGVEGGFSNLC